MAFKEVTITISGFRLSEAQARTFLFALEHLDAWLDINGGLCEHKDEGPIHRKNIQTIRFLLGRAKAP